MAKSKSPEQCPEIDFTKPLVYVNQKGDTLAVYAPKMTHPLGDQRYCHAVHCSVRRKLYFVDKKGFYLRGDGSQYRVVRSQAEPAPKSSARDAERKSTGALEARIALLETTIEALSVLVARHDQLFTGKATGAVKNNGVGSTLEKLNSVLPGFHAPR